MKKLLSIFSISAILGSGTILSGGGIACGSSAPQFNLSKLDINNIPVSASATKNFVIDGQKAYSNAVSEIIKQYKKTVPTSTLSSDDFNLNSTTLDANHTWAIQIYNLDGTTPIKNSTNQTLTLPSDYSVLKDNALNVKITTNYENAIVKKSNSNDSNQKQVSVEGFLNKFIYTNKNANKGNVITADTHKTATQNNLLKANVIDFSNGEYNLGISNLLCNKKTVSGFENGLYNLNSDKKELISKAIVTNLNAQLKDETSKLVASKTLKTASNNVPTDKAIPIDKDSVEFYQVDENGNVAKLTGSKINSDLKIFIQIKLPQNWDYLSNYLSNQPICVYGYLGEAKFNLSDISTLNTVRVSENSQGKIIFDGIATYNSIRAEIIKEYNKMYSSPSQQLSPSDFKLASATTTTEKPWAIQILNGDGTQVANTANQILSFSSTHTLANDALKINIKTTNTNVLNKEVTLNGYLNKFAFSNADANKGHNFVISTEEAQPEINPNNVIDFTAAGNYHMDFTDPAAPPYSSTNHMVTYLNKAANILKVSNAIIDNINLSYTRNVVNEQLQSEIPKIQHLNLGNIQTNKITIDLSTVTFYARANQGTGQISDFFSHVRYGDLFNHNKETYIQIKVSDWSYLTTNNYITPATTYVYAYLGITPAS